MKGVCKFMKNLDEKYHERPFTERKFKCLSSFESEGRYCNKGEVYTARVYEGDYTKFIFENGDMNFTDELFERVVEAWSDVLVEITG